VHRRLPSVWYTIIGKKLRKYGINGIAHEWFTSYLKDHKQRVDFDNHLSTESIFNISVIQGSILGPILFLIYINYLYNALALLKLMFADDTAGTAYMIYFHSLTMKFKKLQGGFALIGWPSMLAKPSLSYSIYLENTSTPT
jgi:hypothetical protein